MSQKQKQARLDYVLIANLAKDYDGMIEEREEHYSEILKENEGEKNN